MEPGHQALRLNRANLLRRKIHHRHHLLADQVIRLVAHGNLGAGFQYPNLLTEINMQYVGGLAGCGEYLGRNHFAHAQFHLKKILEADVVHDSGLFHELRFQLHCADAVDLAVDIVVAIHQADVLDLGTYFHHKR
uniref:Uncharacterized protein n=2 Tax=prokaryotic environmental samples TaxID=81490 RepID=B3T3L8_9ZZZZ|nr:hypothetical protein ALOHA_HF4000ANIW133B20ctg3g10 [uncultured marine microorganism HF4000_ANIW133B20]ABZ07618.1 hypothetical protein ALOHA_HF4000ANIW137K11ctg5g9 [uncultured marine microorganism HF4000_ANIW137K11]